MERAGLKMPRERDRHDGRRGRWRRCERIGLPRDRAPGVHARRPRRRHRPHARRSTARSSRRGLAASPIGQVLHRPVGARLGRVRARGHARPQRQRRDRLLDREHRPDGRAHRRLVTVAPQQTLTDRLYQQLRDQAITVHPRGRRRDRRLQRAVRGQPGDRGDPRHRDEPARVALVARWPPRPPGFPIAKIAARLAVGYALEEIDQRHHAASRRPRFEPTIDYVVVKWPRFAFEKFPGADPELSTHMKSVGEAMAIGRTFAPGVRARRCARASSTRPPQLDALDAPTLLTLLERPTPRPLRRAARGLPPRRDARGRPRAGRRSTPGSCASCRRSRSTRRRRSPASARSSPSTPAPPSSPRATPYFYSGWERRAAHEVERGDSASAW